jgi:hypothetical protein
MQFHYLMFAVTAQKKCAITVSLNNFLFITWSYLIYFCPPLEKVCGIHQ